MRSRQYDPISVTARPARRVVEAVPADRGLVVEEASTGFCGAVVECDKAQVSLEDRHGKVRVFPLEPAAFLLDGVPVRLTRPVVAAPRAPTRTASGSVAVKGLAAQVAKAGRIWVEGTHDAELVERVWGHDLRVEGVVVERWTAWTTSRRWSARSVPVPAVVSGCWSTTSSPVRRRAASWPG